MKTKAKRAFSRENILRFVLCLAVAFFLWLFVMYVENPEYEREYDDIRVEVRNAATPYDYDLVFPEKVTASFRGTSVALAGCDSEDIIAVIYLDNSIFTDKRSVVVEYEFKDGVKLTPLEEMRLNVSYREVTMHTKEFNNVPVTVQGVDGSTELANYEISAAALSSVTVKGRQEDISALQISQLKPIAILSADDINAIRAALANGGTTERTLTVTFETESGMSYLNAEGGFQFTTTATFTASVEANGDGALGEETEDTVIEQQTDLATT